MAITFYATNNFTGDGTTVNWNINFADGYIDTTNVEARYLDNTGSYVDIAISSVAGNVVTISPAVANGQEFQIYRDTEKRFPLVDFSDGAILNETNLDTLATQAVMVSAEAFDQSNNGVRIAGDALTISQGIDAKAQEALDNSEAAVTTADGIAGTANTALSNSQTALNTANAAKSTADGIAATANQALTNSNTAITTANGAVTTANAAASTANGINAKATQALNNSNTAVNDASAALTTANAIDDKAQTALDNTVALDAATMKKAANLSDIADKAAAWLNVRPIGSTPLAADPVNPLDATTRQWVEARRSVNDSWGVVNGATTLPGSGVTVAGGLVRSEYKLNSINYATSELSVRKTVGSDVSTTKLTSTSYDSSGIELQKAEYYFGSDGYLTTTSLIVNTTSNSPATITGQPYSTINIVNTTGSSDIVGRMWRIGLNGVGGFNFIGRKRDDSTTGQVVINLPASSGTLALQGTSGINYKKDIVDANAQEALDRVLNQRMVNFVYTDDEQGRVRFGVIAEEAAVVAPQYIKHHDMPYEDILDSEGNKVGELTRDRPSVDNNPIVMDLMGCVQALHAKIAALEARIDELTSQ